MAEDKRVRVTADVSPLRQLREEALSLYREIDQAAAHNDQTVDKNLQQLREQLSLMEDRNELEKILVDLRKQAADLVIPAMPSTPPNLIDIPSTPLLPLPKPDQIYNPGIIDKESGTIIWDVPQEEKPQQEKKRRGRPKKEKPSEPSVEIEEGTEEESSEETVTPKEGRRKKSKTPNSTREILQEINRHVESIDESVTKVDRSKREIDESHNIENKSENIVNKEVQNEIENKSEHIVNIERDVENVNEKPSDKKPEPPIEDKRPVEDGERRQVVQNPNAVPVNVEVNLDTNEIIKAIDSVRSAVETESREIVKAVKNIKLKLPPKATKATGDTRYLSTMTDSISRIEDEVADIAKILAKRINNDGNTNTPLPPIPGDTSGNRSGSTLLAGGGGLLAGIAIGAWLNQIKNLLADRYFRNQSAGLRSEYQGTVEMGANFTRVRAANEADMYRWIPFIGNVIAKSIELPANIAAERMVATVQKYFEAENRVTPYAQTFGLSTRESMSVAQREGAYAANALGMDVGSYLERRADLARAAGGRAPGGDEYDPTARRESQSLMAAERLFGLSASSVNRLQGSMRFGDENNSYGGSAVIRLFERTMKELQLPFSEIVSTMDESLETFSKQADQILSKAGEFDAGKIAAVLTGIRAATGMQGRQLERVQDAFSGGGMSQDEVTRALLLRTLTNQDKSISTFSKAMSKLEKIQQDPELMRDFLLDLRSLTQNNEQFINVLKGVFPNLSYNDLRDLFANETNIDNKINDLYDKVGIKKKEIDENDRAAYEPTAAQQTVGSGQRIQASDTNRQIGQGARSLKDILESIEKGVNGIDGKLGENWKNYIDAAKGQFEVWKDFATGKDNLDEAAKKSQMLMVVQLANWTKIMNNIFSSKDER